MLPDRARQAGSTNAGWRAYLTPRVLVFLAIGLAIAYGSFRSTFDILFGTRNPVLAQQVTGAPEAAVRLWTVEAVSNPDSMRNDDIVELGREALASEPLDAAALSSLALHFDSIGERDRARRLATLSEEVSRRDRIAQIILTQLEARSGNMDAAIGHLATALTVTSRQREQLFDLVLPLLASEDVRDQLTQHASDKGDWVPAFLLHAIRKGGDSVVHAADLYLDADAETAENRLKSIAPDLQTLLVIQGEADLAMRVFRRRFPDGGSMLVDPSLSQETTRSELGSFGWSAIQDGASGAQFGPTDGGGFGALVYAEPGERKIAVLRRALALRQGTYELAHEREMTAGDPDASFTWDIKCFSGGQWRIRASSTGDDPVRFTVEDDCEMQLIEFVATTLGSRQPAESIVQNVRLTRL